MATESSGFPEQNSGYQHKAVVHTHPATILTRALNPSKTTAFQEAFSSSLSKSKMQRTSLPKFSCMQCMVHSCLETQGYHSMNCFEFDLLFLPVPPQPHGSTEGADSDCAHILAGFRHRASACHTARSNFMHPKSLAFPSPAHPDQFPHHLLTTDRIIPVKEPPAGTELPSFLATAQGHFWPKAPSQWLSAHVVGL